MTRSSTEFSRRFNEATASTSGATGEVFAVRNEPDPWLKSALVEVRALSGMPDNWDSYGAASVNADSLEQATGLLRELAKIVGITKPTIGLTRSGHVALTWETDAVSLDLEVDPRGLLRFAWSRPSFADTVKEGATRDWGEMASMIARW